MSSPYMYGGQPSNSVPPAQKNNGALIIVVVLLVVLIAIGAGAAILLPKMLRARTAAPDEPVASQPAASSPAAASAATHQPAAASSPAVDNSLPAPGSDNRVNPARSAKTHVVSHRASNVGRGSASDYGSSAQSAADEEARRQAEQRELDRLAHEENLLTSRMAAVEATINTMKQAQAQEGLGMRGDIVAAQERLHGNMDRLEAAIQNHDIPAARQYLQLCDRDAATLDSFVGH